MIDSVIAENSNKPSDINRHPAGSDVIMCHSQVSEFWALSIFMVLFILSIFAFKKLQKDTKK